MIILSRPRAFTLALAAAAAAGGAFVAVHYHLAGLTLSHYDARGHLVVARRIVDSLTPGWQQIGAVWLPLPHLLNALPVQVDAWYRSGASAVTISIAAFAATVGSLAWLILRLTGSRWAAAAGVGAFALNPNVLYLQATPMTEPLLLALVTLAVTLLAEWCARASPAGGQVRPRESSIGAAFALACLTRYEAWPVTAAALGLALAAVRRQGLPWKDAVSGIGRIAMLPAAAIAGFSLFSRVVVGEWFVSGGFFVPENPARGRPLEALGQVLSGVVELSGYGLLSVAIAGLLGLAWLAAWRRPGSWVAVPLSLAATAALPWLAFLRGHPYRIRYMVPVLAVQAIGIGAAAGFVKRARPAAAVALLALAAFELPPLDRQAPMIVEAQWDRPNAVLRQPVTDRLRREYAGEAIMASMGSLGHYMQELAGAGFHVRDFLHEGNGDIWLAALHQPRAYVGWILIEEKAEGGDMLAAIARERPGFLDGFSRVGEGAGVALYRRERPPREAAPSDGSAP